MRLEKQKHFEAESRLRTSIIQGTDYEGKQGDLDRVRRKQREKGALAVRRMLGADAS